MNLKIYILKAGDRLQLSKNTFIKRFCVFRDVPQDNHIPPLGAPPQPVNAPTPLPPAPPQPTAPSEFVETEPQKTDVGQPPQAVDLPQAPQEVPNPTPPTAPSYVTFPNDGIRNISDFDFTQELYNRLKSEYRRQTGHDLSGNYVIDKGVNLEVEDDNNFYFSVIQPAYKGANYFPPPIEITIPKNTLSQDYHTYHSKKKQYDSDVAAYNQYTQQLETYKRKKQEYDSYMQQLADYQKRSEKSQKDYEQAREAYNQRKQASADAQKQYEAQKQVYDDYKVKETQYNKDKEAYEAYTHALDVYNTKKENNIYVYFKKNNYTFTNTTFININSQQNEIANNDVRISYAPLFFWYDVCYCVNSNDTLEFSATLDNVKLLLECE